MLRLNAETLPTLAPEVDRPAYDRGTVTPGIVHLGIGAFHRAHQAVYLDDLLARYPDWGIIGASLRRPDTKNALDPQDGLYSVAVRDASGTRLRVIGSVLEVIDANAERQRLITLMTEPQIRVVSLTVTEKGYCHDPATGELDQSHPDIVHDLARPDDPQSAPGLICAALRARRDAGTAPFTVMSCDNLPANGHTAGRIVARFAHLMNEEFGNWVEANVAFPSTMVDRIVPATTDEDRDEICTALGVEDAWPVLTEPFTQWVIEDRFPAGRPPFEMVGAEMAENVEPFEHMKLRMLNGAHSSLAYLGFLSGYQTVSETIADPSFQQHAYALMTEEVIPTLNVPGTDLAAYRDQLLERFANPALKHRTWQIAMDGSQKLPQRLLGTIRDRLAAGAAITRLTLGVAAWMRYVTGIDEKGQAIDVRDPLAERLRVLADGAGRDAGAMADALLGVREVFGDDLPKSAEFRDRVAAHLTDLFANGAKASVLALAG